MSPRRAAGFTLIELMVALALTGVAVSLVAGSVWAAIETRSRQAESLEAAHRTRVTRDFLREMVRGMAVERASRAELVILEAGRAPTGEPSDRLVFSTRGGTLFGWDNDVKAVELLIDRDPATAHTGLVARVLRAYGGRAVEDTLSLLPDASGFAVRLMDEAGEWRREWPDADRPPGAVEFHVSPPATEWDARAEMLPLRVVVP